VALKQVQEPETAIMQNMTTAANMGATTGKPDTTFEEMLNMIRDSLCDLVSSDDEQDGEDEDDDEEDTELSNVGDDDEGGWLIGTITKTVGYRMESLRQQQLRHDELTKKRCG
jgi:hypothetical protein